MKTLATAAIDSTLHAWECYCDENYEQLEYLSEKEDSPEIYDLMQMVEIEKSPGKTLTSSGRGLFSPLADGVIAHHNADHKMASNLLGNWLLNKDYYAHSIIKKFTGSCISSKNYPLLHRVGKKFLGMKHYSDLIAEPIFLSVFLNKNYKEAVQFFEKYQESFNSEEVIQKAAFAMIQINRFQDAERILISLYEKITGMSYQVNYDKVKEKYVKKIAMIPQLEKKKDISREETMELGMAYLFDERYRDAINIFQRLSESS